MRSLFVALNDEDVKVRALAIEVAGRLSGMNPAYVMPQLRRHLMQLLNDMDHSPDSRQREGEPRCWTRVDAAAAHSRPSFELSCPWSKCCRVLLHSVQRYLVYTLVPVCDALHL